jgi:hypothetical protein
LHRINDTDRAIATRRGDELYSIDRRLDLVASRSEDQQRRERTAVHQRGHAERLA